MEQQVSPATLGYVILYVDDVEASLAFYEEAFGLSRRFFHDDEGKAYGELETGAARLAFASLKLVESHLGQGVTVASAHKPPLGFEVALVTADVHGLFDRAVGAGAQSVSAPETKPWGQTVAYVRDKNGFLVELCTAMP
jgi:lactoylglutathione lyase